MREDHRQPRAAPDLAPAFALLGFGAGSRNDACLDVSSYLFSGTNSSAMPTSEIRNVSRIGRGIEPPVVLSTRGWVGDSAARTAMKLSGTKAPAVIAKTDA